MLSRSHMPVDSFYQPKMGPCSQGCSPSIVWVVTCPQSTVGTGAPLWMCEFQMGIQNHHIFPQLHLFSIELFRCLEVQSSLTAPHTIPLYDLTRKCSWGLFHNQGYLDSWFSPCIEFLGPSLEIDTELPDPCVAVARKELMMNMEIWKSVTRRDRISPSCSCQLRWQNRHPHH